MSEWTPEPGEHVWAKYGATELGWYRAVVTDPVDPGRAVSDLVPVSFNGGPVLYRALDEIRVAHARSHNGPDPKSTEPPVLYDTVLYDA